MTFLLPFHYPMGTRLPLAVPGSGPPGAAANPAGDTPVPMAEEL